MVEQMIAPCPFCGAADIEKTDNGHAEWLRCLTCGATGPWTEPPEDHCFTGTELVDQWNRRAAHSVMAGRVAELEELLRQARCYIVPGGSGYTMREQIDAALSPHPKARNE